MVNINKQIMIIFILLLIMYYYDNKQELFTSKNSPKYNYINNSESSINTGSSDLYGYTSSNRDKNYTVSGIYPPRRNYYENSNDIINSKGLQIGRTRQNRKLI